MILPLHTPKLVSTSERNTDELPELETQSLKEQYLYTARIMRQYTWQIQSYERTLRNMCWCFINQPEIYASQVTEAIERVSSLRNATLNTRVFLLQLQPELTATLLPYGCIEKLNDLDFRSTELLAYLTTFRLIFYGQLRADVDEITQVYLSVRKYAPQLFATFEDAIAQLDGFVGKASLFAGGNYHA